MDLPASALESVLAAAVESRVFPGAVAACGRSDGPDRVVARGRLTYEPGAPATRPDTLYDLASLTKVVVTTTLVAQLAEQGRLSLDQPVRRHLPDLRAPLGEAVTVGHLLDHSSGLPAHLPLYLDTRGAAGFRQRLAGVALEAPPGTRAAYSDLGFLALGLVVERLAGGTLDVLARERVLGPLGLRDTVFCPPAEWRGLIAPTELCPWRGRLLQGEVHDENAFALGGVAPHAGLFGTAGDLARFARCLLNGGGLDGARLLQPATLALFTRRTQRPPGSSRALGWDTPSGEASSAGSRLSPRAFGHTGFTGTSLWVDPEAGLYVLLLSNRVHPSREGGLDAIRSVRRAVADASVEVLGRERGGPAPQPARR